jgi:putative hemolysin
MATPQEALQQLAFTPPGGRRLHVRIAQDSKEIEDCQRLRYRVFAEELGARINGYKNGLDGDAFDHHCKHLVVQDRASGEIVGTTRLLTSEDAAVAGMFYSQSEFDLTRILCLPGRFMEIGRTCIHRDHRNGAALAVLWQGLARIMVLNEIDYLIGCASIPLAPGQDYASAVMSHLRRHCYAPEYLRVFPKVPLVCGAPAADATVQLPPLLKGYVRAGAMICGEPAWDESFNVADVFILLDRDRLDRRYARRFVNRIN